MKRESASERYLRRATRGLWGTKRLEVREEIAGHLAERVTAYQIGGLNEQEATERALAELGAPQFVNRGMVRIHTLPTVMGSSLALIALCLAVVGLWPKGVAQTLTGTSYFPSLECTKVVLSDKNPEDFKGCVSILGDFWVSQEELRNVLEPQGVMFEKAGFAAEILKVSVPGSSPMFIEANSQVYVDNVGEISRGYVSLWNFIERFSDLPDARLKIEDWDSPTIHLNDVMFQLHDANNSFEGQAFYWNYLNAITTPWVSDIAEPRMLSLVFPGEFSHIKPYIQRASLEVKGTPGDVYGMLSYPELSESETGRGSERKKYSALWFQLGRVTDTGNLRMWLPKDGTSFIPSSGSINDLNIGGSVLIRLAGGHTQTGGWYEVVSPESVRLETP